MILMASESRVSLNERGGRTESQTPQNFVPDAAEGQNDKTGSREGVRR